MSLTVGSLELVTVWDGSHQNRDADLFRKVEWDHPKSPDVPMELGRHASAGSSRRSRAHARIVSVAEVRARVAQIRLEAI